MLYHKVWQTFTQEIATFAISEKSEKVSGGGTPPADSGSPQGAQNGGSGASTFAHFFVF